MKQILTAMNNPKINEQLQKEKNIKVIGKDIPYKEGILEILEKNKYINYIFISENLEGEINFLDLLKKIKNINNKIKLIIILNKKNNILENKIKNININNIYYKNKINKKILINIINNNLTINKKNKIFKIKKEKRNLLKKKTNNKIIKKENNKKIILITGGNKVGKTTITLILAYYLSQENYKTAIIDYNFKNLDLTNAIKTKKNTENKEVQQYKIKDKLFLFYNIKINLLNNLVNKIKKNFDYIIIENNINNKEIIKIADYIFFIIKPEIKNIKEIYFKYINNFYNEKEKLFIIINNFENNKISLKIISKIFNQKIIKYKIKYNLIYKKIKNNFNKNKKILNNKYSKKEFKKILLKIKNN